MRTPTHLFIHTATITRHGYVGEHGETDYVDKKTFAIKCRVEVLSTEDTVSNGGDRAELMGRMYCAATEDVRNEDHVTLNGITFYEVVVREPDFMGVYKACDLVAPVIPRNDAN